MTRSIVDIVDEKRIKLYMSGGRSGCQETTNGWVSNHPSPRYQMGPFQFTREPFASSRIIDKDVVVPRLRSINLRRRRMTL